MNAWQIEALLAAIVATFYIGKFIWKNVHPTVAIAFCYSVLEALQIFYSPFSPYRNEAGNWSVAFDAYSSEALCVLFLFSFVALGIKRRGLFLQIIAILNAFLMIFAYFLDKPHGILLNPSMSGCLSAVLLPIFFFGDQYPLYPISLMLVSIAMTGRSLPLLTLACVIAGYCFLKKKYVFILTTFLLCAIVGSVMLHKDFFDSSGRFETWALCFKWWRDHASFTFGTGLGSFSPIGAYLTKPDAVYPTRPVWIWLHSDWGQILFEEGILGFLAISAMYVTALVKSYTRAPLFCALVGYGAFAIGNMPLRYPVSAIVGAVLIAWAFSDIKTQAS